jgi:S1-C subfamily serine protease/Flp pilus assembly protein TadD
MSLSGVKGAAVGASVMFVLAGAAFWVVENSLLSGPKSALAVAPSNSTPNEPSFAADEDPARRADLSADQLFSKVSPSVVRVVARDGKFQTCLGSGFYVSDDGLLVTNYHVVRGAEFADILRADNTTLYVEGIVAEDRDADLALLKVNVTGVQPLQLGQDAPPKIGTKVYAIGNPEGLTNTLSEGLISGVRSDKGGRLRAIQTSAAISHGSSGGPLVTPDGVVVGVTAATVVDGQNLNFAVPAADVRKLIANQGEMRKLASAGVKALDSSQTQEFSAVWDALGRRQYSLASQLLASMRQEQSSNPVYWMATGYLHNQLKNSDLAIDAYRKAIEINAKSEPAWFYLGQAYAGCRRYGEAIEAFREAGKVQPNDDRAYTAAGFAYLGLHNQDKAVECFKFANGISPQMPGPYCGLAIVYNDRGQYDSAEAAARHAVGLKPDYAAAYLQLGIAYSHTNRMDQAYAAWNNARRFDYNGPIGRTAEYFIQRPPR